MNAREAKKRRDADLLALLEAQKGVIGAVVRSLDVIKQDIATLKIEVAQLESERATIQ